MADKTGYLIFQIGQRQFGVSLQDVRGICWEQLTSGTVERPVCTRTVYSSLMKTVTIVDLYSKFDQPHPFRPCGSPMLIIKTAWVNGARYFGIPVDEFVAVTRFSNWDLKPVVGEEKFFVGRTLIKGRQTQILKIQTLLVSMHKF